MKEHGPIWIYQRPGDRCNSAPTDFAVELTPRGVEGHIARFEISFGSNLPVWPIAPGCVYRIDTLEVVIEVHRLERLDKRCICAVTLDGQDVSLPAVALRFRPYWIDQAAEAVLKGPDGWRLQWFPERQPGSHTHDIFDWTTIGTGGVGRAWQFGDRDCWATPENFERYILDDVLGWRTTPTECRVIPLDFPPISIYP